MKKFLATAAFVMAAFVAVPAAANEGRAEVRAGYLFAPGEDQEVVGLALGYDFDLSDTLFAGLEVSGDKILHSGSGITWGGSARLGTSLGESARAYVIGGYTNSCDDCVDSYTAGAGAEYNLSEDVYLKAEYRHFFTTEGLEDFDAVLIGVGIAVE